MASSLSTVNLYLPGQYSNLKDSPSLNFYHGIRMQNSIKHSYLYGFNKTIEINRDVPFQVISKKKKILIRGEAGIESKDELRTLYPSINPYKTGYLQVSDTHSMYYELFGNPTGKPALFLHGGPGAGCFRNHARFFDPKVYQIVLFDQRGCGKSTPRGSILENTTQHLTMDIELLRKHLNVQKWILLGGSWGVTLALHYAQNFPANVSCIILRGVCLLRRQELEWFYEKGANSLSPFSWNEFVKDLGLQEREKEREQGEGRKESILSLYYRRLLSRDASVRESAARSWLRWEMSMSSFSHQTNLLVWNGKDYSFPSSPSPSSPSSSSSPSPSSTPNTNLNPNPNPNPNLKPEPNSNSNPIQNSKPNQKPDLIPNQIPSLNEIPKLESNSEPQSQLKEGKDRVRDSESKAKIGNGPNLKSEPNPNPYKPNSSLGKNSESILQERMDPGSDTSLIPNLNDESAYLLKGSESMSSVEVQARLECHYFYNNGFLKENELLENISKIENIPCIIVHGQFDFVCPVVNAYDLHKAWLKAELILVPKAGHSMYEPGITHQLICATDKFKYEI